MSERKFTIMANSKLICKIHMDCPLCDKTHDVEKRVRIAKTIIKGEEVIGTICFRHELNEELREFGGQIGYSIKPSQRQKGYMTEF